MFILQKYATFWQGLTKHPRYLLALSASTAAFTLLLLIFFCQQALPPIAQQEVELPVKTGVIKGTLWLPASDQQSSPVPGVLLVHGMASSRRTLQQMAKTLAHNGMGAFVFDLQGYGESRNTTAALTPSDPYEHYRDNVIESLHFLQAHPAIQGNAVALIGHSLGAEVLAQLPEHTPGLRIAIGMHPNTGELPRHTPADSPAHLSPHLPPHLQWWTGLYDPLHPPYVHPDKNDYVSPCTGHSKAPEDVCIAHHLHHTLQAFFGTSTAKPQDSTLMLAHLQHGSTVALGGCLLMVLTTLPLAPGGYPLLLSTLIAIAPFLLAGYFRWLYSPYCASAVCLFTLAYFLRQMPVTALKKGLKLLAIFWSAHMITSTLRGGLTLLIAPDLSLTALVYWPLFVFQSLLGLVQMPHDTFLYWAFAQSYARLEPGLLFWGLFTLEIIWPGGIVRTLGRSASALRALFFLKSETAPGIDKNATSQKNRYQLLFLIGLLGALGVLGYWRYQQGFLDVKIVLNLGPLLWGVILPEWLIVNLTYRHFQRVSVTKVPPR